MRIDAGAVANNAFLRTLIGASAVDAGIGFVANTGATTTMIRI